MFYKAIGLMSGTSLDGLDIAYTEFELKEGKWKYRIREAETITYDRRMVERLREAENTSSLEFVRIDKEFGEFMGLAVKEFVDKHGLSPDLIASHGQTIFHQPNHGLTTQIGDINQIAAITGIMTIGDFRRKDLALGGQGAPLVPIGDRLLFHEYPFCLNIGGFSNISFEEDGMRIAYDICPSNLVLNRLCEELGLDYDKDGEIAKNGHIEKDMLSKLNSLEFYKIKNRKSLGKEWVLENIDPILESYSIGIEDKVATFTEHISVQIAKNISGNTLITGGGAYNKHLINQIKSKTHHSIHIPDPIIIDYKEAMIFAFLGILRLRGENNALASVTGARKDSSLGLIAI